MCICECLHGHLGMYMWVPREARRRHQIPWSWSYRKLWATIYRFWKPNLGPLQKWQVPLASKPSLSPQELSKNWFYNSWWREFCSTAQLFHSLYGHCDRSETKENKKSSALNRLRAVWGEGGLMDSYYKGHFRGWRNGLEVKNTSCEILDQNQWLTSSQIPDPL